MYVHKMILMDIMNIFVTLSTLITYWLVYKKCTYVPFQMIALTNSHKNTNVLILYLTSLEYRSEHLFY